jgi:DNA primase
MAKISDEMIKEILDKTDIVDLIGEKVTLTKQGKGYFGLCPFHSEKTPSFSVEPERKIYNCFSCGEKGNSITFLQKTENMSFVEAIEALADRANMDVSFKEFKKENPFTNLYNINSDALNFYKVYLSNTKQGEIATEYLYKRGITKDVIKAFDLGLAPSEYGVLTKTLTAKEILISDLVDLGLSKQSKQETFYDLFRDRIIIPIKDEKGNTVAFSGRVYLDKDKDTAKYINSPQTKIFTKSNVLYNLHNALNFIKQSNRVVLFEGYMDVFASYRADIKEAIASMGTSLTKDQVHLIKRYTPNVTICYDGDKAGMEATQRAIGMFTEAGMNVKVILLPENLDPDDYLNKYGSSKLNEFINDKWVDAIEFTYQRNLHTQDFSKMLEIEQFKKVIFDLIKEKSNTVIELYLTKISTDTNISRESIEQDFEQYTKRRPVKVMQKQNRVLIDSRYINAERRILNYFMKDYKYLKDFNSHDDIEYLYIEETARDLKMLIEDEYFNIPAEQEKKIDKDELIKLMNPELLHYYTSKINNSNLELSDGEYTDCRNVLRDYLKELIHKDFEKRITVAITLEEKIAIAIERDKIQKEENRWIQKK